MDVNDFFRQVISEAEQKAVEATEQDKLIDVFRAHYEDWTQRLFPAWKKAKKLSCHRELALLLNQIGYLGATENQVSKYLKVVRDERAKKGVSPAKKIHKATTEGVTPTPKNPEDMDFTGVDRDWRAIEKLAKGATEWTSEMEEAWLHLKWIADQRKIPFQARRAMDIWAQIGGEPMKCAWLQLKLRRKDYSMNPDL